MAKFVSTKKSKNKTAQEIQDDVFRKMSADEKLAIASRLTMFCIELSKLNHYATSHSQLIDTQGNVNFDTPQPK